jgi:hypothetical protein
MRACKRSANIHVQECASASSAIGKYHVGCGCVYWFSDAVNSSVPETSVPFPLLLSMSGAAAGVVSTSCSDGLLGAEVFSRHREPMTVPSQEIEAFQCPTCSRFMDCRKLQPWVTACCRVQCRKCVSAEGVACPLCGSALPDVSHGSAQLCKGLLLALANNLPQMEEYVQVQFTLCCHFSAAFDSQADRRAPPTHHLAIVSGPFVWTASSSTTSGSLGAGLAWMTLACWTTSGTCVTATRWPTSSWGTLCQPW